MRALAPPMNAASRHVVVVGGGVTGLAAAWAVHRERPDVRVTVLEARDRPGGNIVTEREGGFVVDAGPDSFLRTKPEAVELCRELGLESEFLTTSEAAHHVFIARRGRLESLPGGMALAVPTRLRPLLETPLLGPGGKLRLLMEPFVRARTVAKDESIAAFFTRRLGRQGAEAFAGPLLGGIYAGDVARLSIRSTFPQLVELEEKYGSLFRGLLTQELRRTGQPEAYAGILQSLGWLGRRGGARPPSPFLSLKGGMGTLIAALVNALPGGTVRAKSPVTAVTRAGGGFGVETNGEHFHADAVILAAPAHVAARLVPDAALARELSAIPYLSTATVFFALERAQVKHPLVGSGFIVPPGEAGILAATWVSSKWPGRAPEGAVLVRAFVGGARDPDRVARSTDAELLTLARGELERLMGPLGAARFTRVFRYIDANPQPLVGHAERLGRIQARLSELPGLHVAGAAYDGVGIPDCVRQARTAASAMLERLRP